MANKLNKHTPDSEELLKRLENNDSSGLDDFEKEALEGFDSINNIEKAKLLTNSLNQKIDEVYFKKESSNKKGWAYLSMAAGLILIVGLSIFFTNILGDKKEMAMSTSSSTEEIANEVSSPTDLSPAPIEEVNSENQLTEKSGKSISDNTIVTKGALSEQSNLQEPNVSNADRRKENEEDKDDGLNAREIKKEVKPVVTINENKLADSENRDQSKILDAYKTSGPPAGNVSSAPKTIGENELSSTIQPSKDKTKEEKPADKITLAKANEDAKGKEGDMKKRATPKKQKNASGEGLGNDDIESKNSAEDESTIDSPTNLNQTAAGGIPSTSKNTHNIEFTYRSYTKPQDYIKDEIDKSEMLKSNVKAFKADLTINDKGIVTAVKFLSTFDNCTGCKKELEKILLNMPGWKPKTKSATETVSYIDQ